MPFFDGSGRFPQPAVERADPQEWILRTGSATAFPNADFTTALVPPIRTDFPSIPGPLRRIFEPGGKLLLPLLLHDKLCDDARAAPPKQQLRLRRYADDVFFVALQDQANGNRHVLRDQSVSIPQSRVLWAGVSVGRYFEHTKPRFVGVLLLLLAATAAIYTVPVLVQMALDRWWLTIIIWLVVISLAQVAAATTRFTKLVFMLLVGAAVVVPMVARVVLAVASKLGSSTFGPAASRPRRKS
jgi:hypothetical protein